MELSLQYLSNLLHHRPVDDDLCHNLISFNGVSVKIKREGWLTLAPNPIQKATADVPTQHLQERLLQQPLSTPSKPGAGDRGPSTHSTVSRWGAQPEQQEVPGNRNNQEPASNVVQWVFPKEDFHRHVKSYATAAKVLKWRTLMWCPWAISLL